MSISANLISILQSPIKASWASPPYSSEAISILQSPIKALTDKFLQQIRLVFQFYKVRLKRVIFFEVVFAYPYFNSTKSD